MSKEHQEEDEIEMLVKTINDNPDRLHVDSTPSVQRLIQLGLPGATAVVDLLNAPDLHTRLRAQRVLEGVVMRMHGWRPGQGYRDSEGQERTMSVLSANGDYKADAPQRKRKSAIGKWRHWLEAQMKKSNS